MGREALGRHHLDIVEIRSVCLGKGDSRDSPWIYKLVRSEKDIIGRSTDPPFH